MESVLRGCIVSVQGRRSLAQRPVALRSWTTETRKLREKAAGEEEVGGVVSLSHKPLSHVAWAVK